MLRKKEAYTVVTPIPSFIPRQLAIDILHSHSEVITLNPLVLSHKAIPAPRNAAADEFYSTWYEITERVQVVPGMGKLGSSKINFNGCFHDMPWGLQTHIYAPFNIDLRNRYRIAGNQPGEPPEVREIGLESLGAPADGLYLREDIEIRCNVTMTAFVKAQLKAASKEMVSRIIKKAELLDAGILQAMMLDGRLKTINPNDRSQSVMYTGRTDTGLHSPPLPNSSPSPRLSYQPHRHSGSAASYTRPSTSSSQFSASQQATGYQQAPYNPASYQQGQAAPLPLKEQQAIPMELPGDFQYAQPSPGLQHSPGLQPSPGLSPGYHQPYPGAPRWQQPQQSPNSDHFRQSVSSVTSSNGHPSPGFAPQAYTAELPAHQESPEEYYRKR